MSQIAVKLSARNDANGNPQRVFVVLDEQGEIVAAVDEGYDGRNALARAGIDATISQLDISVDGPTYTRTLRDYGPECRRAIIEQANKLLGQGESSNLQDASESSRYEGSDDKLLTAAVDRIAMNGDYDEQANGGGEWVARVGRFILHESELGFVTLRAHDQSGEAEQTFNELAELIEGDSDD